MKISRNRDSDVLRQGWPKNDTRRWILELFHHSPDEDDKERLFPIGVQWEYRWFKRFPDGRVACQIIVMTDLMKLSDKIRHRNRSEARQNIQDLANG